MSLMPNEVTVCAVNYGPAISFIGQGGTIRARLRADRPVIHAASGVRLYVGNDELTANPGIPLQFSVPHVDQPGFIAPNGENVIDWHYVLEGTITFGTKARARFSRTFQVFSGETSVDLDLRGDDIEEDA